MNFFDMIAPDFFKDSQGLHNLVWRYASGARSHRSLAKMHTRLKEAVAKGQTPEFAVYYNGDVPGTTFLGLTPAEAFCASGMLFVPTEQEQNTDSLPILNYAAAAEYAQHLGVKKHVMIFNSGAIGMDYLRSTEKSVPFMETWKKGLSPIIKELSELHKTQDLEKLYPLVGQEILLRNATKFEQILGIKVAPLYYDKVANRLTVYRRKGLKGRFAPVGKPTQPFAPYAHQAGFPHAVGCSCCDSRALHQHIYTGQPGEFLEINSIAAIIPHRKEFMALGQSNSAWATIEYAHDILGIREFSVTGHKDCGGAAGLVKWGETGNAPSGYVGAWLSQAFKVVKDTVDYANANGFTSAQKHRLAEIRVSQWSAGNIKREYPTDSQVLPLYYDTKDRIVYPLPAIRHTNTRRSMQETADCVLALETGNFPNLTEVDEERQRRARKQQKRVCALVEVSLRPR